MFRAHRVCGAHYLEDPQDEVPRYGLYCVEAMESQVLTGTTLGWESVSKLVAEKSFEAGNKEREMCHFSCVLSVSLCFHARFDRVDSSPVYLLFAAWHWRPVQSSPAFVQLPSKIRQRAPSQVIQYRAESCRARSERSRESRCSE